MIIIIIRSLSLSFVAVGWRISRQNSREKWNSLSKVWIRTTCIYIDMTTNYFSFSPSSFASLSLSLNLSLLISLSLNLSLSHFLSLNLSLSLSLWWIFLSHSVFLGYLKEGLRGSISDTTTDRGTRQHGGEKEEKKKAHKGRILTPLFNKIMAYKTQIIFEID